MSLTKERATILSEFLVADEARAASLGSLQPNEVMEKVNSYGYDFKLEEIVEFGAAVSAAAEGELDVDALDDVAGGSVTGTAALIAAVAAGVSAISSVVSSRW